MLIPGSQNDEYALLKLTEQQDYWVARGNDFNLRLVRQQIADVKERINQRKRVVLAGILGLEVLNF